MKKVKYIVREVNLILATLAISLLPLVNVLPARAESPSLWVNNEQPGYSVVGPNQTTQHHVGEQCQLATITVSQGGNGLPPYQNISTCTVKTSFGELAHGFLKFNHSNEYVMIDGSYVGGPVLTPNSDSLYVIKAANGFRFLHAYNNPSAQIVAVEPGPNGWAYAYRTYSPTDWTLKDDENKPILTRATAISKNGRWMAIEVPSGIIRLDLQTREFLKFTAMVPPYGVGKNPTLHMAISNDGKYVAVGGSNYNEDLNLYDVSMCIPPATQGSTAVAQGCGHHDLTEFMEGQIFDFNGAFYLDFNNDSTQLSMNTKAGRVVLQAPNTTVSYLDYLGLGDSFSSGEGAYAYLPGTDSDGEPIDGVDTSIEKCHVSSLSYPLVVGFSSGIGSSQFKNISCSGAITDDITNTNASYKGQQGRIITADPDISNGIKTAALESFTPGRAAQVQFVEKYKPKAVTLTIGGNDVGFSGKLTECIVSPVSCAYASDPSTKRGVFDTIKKQFDQLTSLYTALHDASPNTKTMFWVIRTSLVTHPRVALIHCF